jgi:curli biogenesis system outer membrane secretion channel CsgG
MKKLNQILTITTACCMAVCFNNAVAQDSKDKKDEKKTETQVRMEAVQAKCKDVPLDKRIRITVARFTSTAGNSPATLGENMSTMLSNALSQVNCFNVLEEQKHMNDMTGEIDAANSEYVDAGSAIEKGRMKVAQIVVTGEVTEYNDATSGGSTLGIGATTSKAKIGFILKVINPRTREILKSTSFNVESKKGSSMKVMFITSKSSSNPAVADALEKGIIQATEYLAAEKDNIPLPSADDLSSTLTTVTVTNVTFSQKSNTLDMLKNTAGVKSAELSNFANNTATYSVKHAGSSDDLATVIDKKYSGRFEITDAKSGKITMKLNK